MTSSQSDFYFHLQSNASTNINPNNGPSGFKVVLLNLYELNSDEWQVALVGLLYPHTWVNMSGPNDEELVAFGHQGVFYARIFSRKRPTSYNDANKYPRRLLGCIAHGAG